jgi:hypothetical protein
LEAWRYQRGPLHEGAAWSYRSLMNGRDVSGSAATPTPQLMKKEFEYLNLLGIKAFKIRDRNNQVEKACFALKEGRKYGIDYT